MISEKQARHHNNSAEIIGDMIYFKDPFTEERLTSDYPPESLEWGAGLSEGFNYLRNNPDIQVAIFGENHGDNSFSDAGEVRGQLERADVIFLEGYNHSTEVGDLFWSTAYDARTPVSAHLSESLSAYKLRQLDILAGYGKPVFFPEVPQNGSQYERDLVEFIEILDELRPMAIGGDENFALAVEINLAASSIMREWYMIGKMGLMMQAYEKATGQKLKNPLLWIGYTHTETMPDKLHGLGVQVVSQKSESQRVESVHKSATGEYRRTNASVPYIEAARDGLARLIPPR